MKKINLLSQYQKQSNKNNNNQKYFEVSKPSFLISSNPERFFKKCNSNRKSLTPTDKSLKANYINNNQNINVINYNKSSKNLKNPNYHNKMNIKKINVKIKNKNPMTTSSQFESKNIFNNYNNSINKMNNTANVNNNNDINSSSSTFRNYNNNSNKKIFNHQKKLINQKSASEKLLNVFNNFEPSIKTKNKKNKKKSNNNNNIEYFYDFQIFTPNSQSNKNCLKIHENISLKNFVKQNFREINISPFSKTTKNIIKKNKSKSNLISNNNNVKKLKNKSHEKSNSITNMKASYNFMGLLKDKNYKENNKNDSTDCQSFNSFSIKIHKKEKSENDKDNNNNNKDNNEKINLFINDKIQQIENNNNKDINLQIKDTNNLNNKINIQTQTPSKKEINININLNSSIKEPKKILKYIYKIETICKKGYSGPGVVKVNQDNFFISKKFNSIQHNYFLGVCDGHGIFGHDVSGYLIKKLPIKLQSSFTQKNILEISSTPLSTLSPIIIKTFEDLDKELVADESVDSSFSGSTCVTLLYTPTRLICNNVGDSRCVIGKCIDNEKWIGKNLSRDHKPSEPDERKRILSKNGRIQAYLDENGNNFGPERVWIKTDDVPGLAMSRSFGDEVAHSVGVIAKPEILEYEFSEEDKFIILASDGIWEFINSDECVNLIKDFYLKKDLTGALKFLYKEASKRWIMNEEVIDDITAVLVYLN